MAENRVMLYGYNYDSNFSDRQNAEIGWILLIKHTNGDIKDAACLHIVHILQHSTSHPSKQWTQTTMVNPPKSIFWPHLVGKYGISTNHFTWRCNQTNKDKGWFEAESVWAPAALHSLRSKMQLVAQKRQATHFLRNTEKEEWLKDYIERETFVARKRVEDKDTVIM